MGESEGELVTTEMDGGDVGGAVTEAAVGRIVVDVAESQARLRT